MKKNLLFITMLIGNLLAGQTSDQLQKILESYDLEKINALVDELRLGETEKEQMLEMYLASNPDIKKEYYKGEKLHVLYDVIDNTSLENWVDIVYGQGLPIRIEALSNYKLKKLDDMINIIQNQIKVKVLK